MKRLLIGSICMLSVFVVVAGLLDEIVFTEPAPGDEYVPRVGQTFASRSEGFRQTVVKRADGLVWLELELEPHAPGPPEHIHGSFAEYFVVAEGELTLLVNGEKRILRSGDSYLVPPGTAHKPSNETGERVIIRSPQTPEYALPEHFVVFLKQAYGFFDEPNRSGLSAMLQMSRFGPDHDVWLSAPPIAVQKLMNLFLRPAARLLGYRGYYEQYKPA